MNLKKMLLIGGVLGVVSFVAGLAGLYLMMPSVAPALVVDTKLQLDSLGLIKYRDADSIRSIRSVRDSLYTPGDSTMPPAGGLAAFDTTAWDAAPGTAVDSLRRVLDRIRTVEQEKNALLTEVETLTSRIQAMEGLRVEAEALGTTLAKLEDKQLGAILQNLDPRVLELLYLKASARTQARLMQSLPPERAASFIRSLVKLPPGSDPAPPPTTPTAAASTTEGASER